MIFRFRPELDIHAYIPVCLERCIILVRDVRTNSEVGEAMHVLSDVTNARNPLECISRKPDILVAGLIVENTTNCLSQRALGKGSQKKMWTSSVRAAKNSKDVVLQSII